MDEEFEIEDRDEGVTGINITPLVDVCLVLVLIFMVTTPFFTRTLMEVALPRAATAEAEAKENISISISPTEGFAINEKVVEKAALYRELRREVKASGFTFVLIRADEKISHGDVEDVMKAAKRAGAKHIAFATSPK